MTTPAPVTCQSPICSSPQTCQQTCPKLVCCQRFNDMIDGCLPICFKKCAPVCPRRCCGPHPPLVKRIGQRIGQHIGQRPKLNDISLSGCPKICADICALECPHRCCGPGSLKRSFIPRRTPQLAYMKNNYAYAAKRFQVPLSRYSKPRGFSLQKKRHVMHQ